MAVIMKNCQMMMESEEVERGTNNQMMANNQDSNNQNTYCIYYYYYSQQHYQGEKDQKVCDVRYYFDQLKNMPDVKDFKCWVESMLHDVKNY